jgi:DNA-binding response OmpR family regulator
MNNLKIMIVEDEALIALDLAMAVEEKGAQVVGPFMALPAALAGLETETPDAAILDVDIRGNLVFPLADRLADKGIPFVFQTGRLDIAALDTYRTAVHVKPVEPERVLADLAARLAPPHNQFTSLS